MIYQLAATLLSMQCEPIDMQNLKLLFPITKPGKVEIPIELAASDYVLLATKNCDHSRKLQFTIWHGTKYGVALLHQQKGLTVQTFEKGLFEMKPEIQTFPFYVVVKAR